ncbi:MAG: hypothetical protein KDD73_12260 [Anaerolineales bacterium]|nr:hypothetical protein [Anaerolineales bacterium]MCB9129018.1 hypothetical protein [Ardenticatenales bacterium]
MFTQQEERQPAWNFPVKPLPIDQNGSQNQPDPDDTEQIGHTDRWGLRRIFPKEQ